jgi:hypothetical protein
MANAVTGLLYKKIMNADGTVKSKVPFLVRTAAKFVIAKDGKSLQTIIDEHASAISSLQSSAAVKSFDTLEEYTKAYEAGELEDGTLAIIKD